jgi:hypothetical protein
MAAMLTAREILEQRRNGLDRLRARAALPGGDVGVVSCRRPFDG